MISYYVVTTMMYKYKPSFIQYKQANPNDVFEVLRLADLLRHRDLTFHDGGSVQEEGLQIYEEAIEILLRQRAEIISRGESTTKLPSTVSPQMVQALELHYQGDEFFLQDHKQKSMDGLLSAVYSALSKLYFMANMFEKSVEAATKSLKYKPGDMDALNGRGSSLNILGRYREAAADYAEVITRDGKYGDNQRLFAEAFTGLSKILVADEQVVEGGWDAMISIIENTFPKMERQLAESKMSSSQVSWVT
jgi:tetratricopeptide (TPR) repeat protein